MPINLELCSPLKLQVAIRDCWDSRTSAAQAARAALHGAVGYPVHIDPEWLQLLSALDSLYPDRQALAAAVAGCVEIWCKVFTDLVDGAESADDAQKEWSEALMENLVPAVGLRLFIDVAGADASGASLGGASAGTRWSDERSAFYLYLPAKKAVTVPGEFEAVYRSGLLACFRESKKNGDNEKEKKEKEKKEKQTLPYRSGDDWADIEMDSATGTAQVIDKPVTAAPAPPPPKLEYLPSAESLPRPDELFLRPPYHMVVADYGNRKVVVQGSHSPSLGLLGEYMKRWCRLNHNDSRSPPAVEVKYNQSCWGAGPMHDEVTLTSEGNNIYKFNPAIVLAFVEGVLGYDLVSTEQGIWTYRRTEAFKG